MVGVLMAVVAAVLVWACGKSEETPPPSPCPAAFNTLCQKACDCGNGDCRIVFATDAGSVGSMSWKSFSECSSFFGVLVCGGAPASFDAQACATAANAAACTNDPTGAGVVSPPACDTGHADAGP